MIPFPSPQPSPSGRGSHHFLRWNSPDESNSSTARLFLPPLLSRIYAVETTNGHEFTRIKYAFCKDPEVRRGCDCLVIPAHFVASTCRACLY